MRCVSASAEKQRDIEIGTVAGVATIYLRANHREVETTVETVTAKGKTTTTKEKHWECDEASMLCPAEDAPAPDEVAEDFEAWFEYVAGWTQAKQKSLAQIQADVEYIAAMTGVELEV